MPLAMKSAQDGMTALRARSRTAEEVILHCPVESAAARGAVSTRRRARPPEDLAEVPI